MATVEKNGVDAEANVITALFDKLPEDMTESQHTVVKNLLKNYDDVFSRGVFDMGRTSLVEHVIDTGDHRPIRQGFGVIRLLIWMLSISSWMTCCGMISSNQRPVLGLRT